MARRTRNEIEKDYKRIRSVLATQTVTSIKDIAKATNLSESEVRTSLSKHPRVESNVKKLLEKNRCKIQSNKKVESEDLNKDLKQRTQKKTKNEKNNSDVVFVIDASICGIENLQDILSDILAKKAKIILTSITIKELEKLQGIVDISGKDARHILAIAAENQESFCSVLIDESVGIPDDCIIKYCADHKEDVILLTSDKTMALKARMYEVKTQYYKHTNDFHDYKTENSIDLITLHVAKAIGDKLVIYDFDNDYRSILVISDGIEYSEAPYELKIGDDVYIATKKPQYMTFAHYKITSLESKYNCRLVYSRRIYSSSEINILPKAGYKSFMRDFKRNYDL